MKAKDELPDIINGPRREDIQAVALRPQMPSSEQLSGVALIGAIERAAMNPAVDVDKMQKLLDMAERVRTQLAREAYDSAFADMQPDLPVINERGQITVNNQVRSTYAKWEDINDAIKPILFSHGFGLSFRVKNADNKITVTGILSHRMGHREETSFELPSDTSGSKNAVQAIGSSTSYGKRYAAGALLNITSRAPADRDDDGKAADTSNLITDEQFGALRKRLLDAKLNEPEFLTFMEVEKLGDIKANDFKKAMQGIDNAERHAKRAQQKAQTDGH